MPEVTPLQQQVIEQFNTLGAASVGQFKQIMPLPDSTKAVAIVRASDGLQAKHDLEHENNLLKILKENGFPALNTYDGVFEISKGKYGLVMDYLTNCSLLDSKAPDMMKVLLPALMMGVPIDTGREAWAMQLPAITRNVLTAMRSKDPDEIRNFASNLGTQIKQLMQTMQEKGLVIADLQMLIDPKGKITIIDPLDVLRVVPKKPPEQGIDFVDVVDPKKPNSAQFINSLFESMGMLEDIAKTCDAIAVTKNEHLPKVISSLMTSARPRAGSMPGSPVMERRPPERRSQSAPPALGGASSSSREVSSDGATSSREVSSMKENSKRVDAVVPRKELAKARASDIADTLPKRPKSLVTGLKEVNTNSEGKVVKPKTR